MNMVPENAIALEDGNLVIEPRLYGGIAPLYYRVLTKIGTMMVGDVSFQSGDPKYVGPNGVTEAALIAIVKHRLESKTTWINDPRLAKEYALAIHKLSDILGILNLLENTEHNNDNANNNDSPK